MLLLYYLNAQFEVGDHQSLAGEGEEVLEVGVLVVVEAEVEEEVLEVGVLVVVEAEGEEVVEHRRTHQWHGHRWCPIRNNQQNYTLVRYRLSSNKKQ